jgi:hypothetical protein
MPEIQQLRARAHHYRLAAGSCDAATALFDSVDKRALLQIAQDFDDEAGRAEEIKRRLM